MSQKKSNIKNRPTSAKPAIPVKSSVPKDSETVEQQPKEPQRKFMANDLYFTISIYVLVVVAISTLIIRVIMTPHAVSNSLANLLGILMPFLMGLLIALVLNPIVKRLIRFLNEKCNIKNMRICKTAALVITYLFVFGILAICVLYIIPQIIISITELVNKLPELYNVTYDFFNNLQERFPTLDVTELQKMVDEILPEVVNTLRNVATGLVPAVYNISVGIVSGVLNFIIAVIVSVYMLVDKTSLQHSMRKIIYGFVPVSFIDVTMDIVNECNHVFTNFITGKAVDSAIIGILCFIFMNIFNMQYSLLISVIVGITNMIPYFGPFIGAVPGVLILLLISPLKAFGFAVLILVLQQFDGLYLGPKILGESIGLKPLWIIFSITIGGSLAGVLGMFLSVPLVAILYYVLNLILEYRLKKRNITLKD